MEIKDSAMTRAPRRGINADPADDIENQTRARIAWAIVVTGLLALLMSAVLPAHHSGALKDVLVVTNGLLGLVVGYYFRGATAPRH